MCVYLVLTIVIIQHLLLIPQSPLLLKKCTVSLPNACGFFPCAKTSLLYMTVFCRRNFYLVIRFCVNCATSLSLFKAVLTVSPSTGIALNTSFTLSVSEGCEDADDDDVTYAFAYISEGQAVPFPRQSDSEFSTTFPPGNYTFFFY